MATIKENQISYVKNLYSKGYSAREIGEELEVPIDAVYYCMRRYKINRRNRSEMRNAAFLRKDLSYTIKTALTQSDKDLKIAGILLYWAEGSKWSGEKQIDFANSDPAMIKIFVKFLRDICSVDDKKLRAYLYCHTNQNPNELIRYWSQATRIPISQFTKTYIKRGNDSNKKSRMEYGLLHIRYSDLKLFNQIMQWIQEIKTNLVN